MSCAKFRVFIATMSVQAVRGGQHKRTRATPTALVASEKVGENEHKEARIASARCTILCFLHGSCLQISPGNRDERDRSKLLNAQLV